MKVLAFNSVCFSWAAPDPSGTKLTPRVLLASEGVAGSICSILNGNRLIRCKGEIRNFVCFIIIHRLIGICKAFVGIRFPPDELCFIANILCSIFCDIGT